MKFEGVYTYIYMYECVCVCVCVCMLLHSFRENKDMRDNSAKIDFAK